MTKMKTKEVTVTTTNLAVGALALSGLASGVKTTWTSTALLRGGEAPQLPKIQETREQVPAVILQASTEDFHNRLEDFMAQVTMALPQALLPTPPKKLGALFKQPLTPSAV
ncbi:hypothetical protein ABZP36_006529 [Zizania latifolia]